MKRTTSRRPAPGREVDYLVRVALKLDGGRALSAAEQRWLSKLLADISADTDVRDRFWVKSRGAPTDREKQARADNCARWIAMRTRPGLEDRLTVAQAKIAAEKEFRMTEEQVRRAWLAHGATWREFAKRVPGR